MTHVWAKCEECGDRSVGRICPRCRYNALGGLPADDEFDRWGGRVVLAAMVCVFVLPIAVGVIGLTASIVMSSYGACE